MDMKVEIKPWLLKQMKVWLPYVKAHTARPNGDETKAFKAKTSEDPDSVITNRQVGRATLTLDEAQTIWDSIQ